MNIGKGRMGMEYWDEVIRSEEKEEYSIRYNITPHVNTNGQNINTSHLNHPLR
jgi:hypothetical protein